MGALVGGVLGVWLLATIWEWALFKRVLDDPVAGKAASVICAYLTAATIWGFASANGGPFTPSGLLVYLPGLFIIGIWWGIRGVNLRNEAHDYSAGDNDRLRDTFE